MTDRQQSAFFFAIIFLFTSGIGLVIYKQYDQYYSQKTEIDLEAASTTIVPVKKVQASTQSQATTLKTYKNDQYGFEFQYPGNLVVGQDIIVSFYSLDKFKGTLTDGASEEDLSYDSANNQWNVSLGINETAADAFCPFKRTTVQKLPFYQVTDIRANGLGDMAYVTKKGIILITYQNVELDPAQIKFINTNDLLTVGCNF